MRSKILSLIFLFSLFSISVSAQIVTPSLDPALPAETAAASSWRFGSTIAAEGLGGDYKTDEEELDVRYLRYSGLFAWQPSHVTSEVYYTPKERIYSVDLNDDTHSESNMTEAILGLSIRGQNRVSVGINYKLSDTEDSSADVTGQRSFGGSFSVRVLDGFFIAAGLERVAETDADDETVRWNQIQSGVAFQLGDPFSHMFRVEASLTSAPEVKNAADQVQKYKTDTIQLSAEMLVSGILVSYHNKRTTLKEVSTDDLVNTNNRYGLGWRGDNMAIIFYYHNGNIKWGEKEYTNRKIQATWSFSFM